MSYGTAYDLMMGQRNKLEQEKRFHEDILEGLKTHKQYQRAPEGLSKTRYREQREQRARNARDELDRFNRHFRNQVDQADRAGKASRNAEKQQAAQLKLLELSLKKSGAAQLAALKKTVKVKQTTPESPHEKEETSHEKEGLPHEKEATPHEKVEESPSERKKQSREREPSLGEKEKLLAPKEESPRQQLATHKREELGGSTHQGPATHERKETLPQAEKPPEEKSPEEVRSKHTAKSTQTSTNEPMLPAPHPDTETLDPAEEGSAAGPRLKKPKTNALHQLTLEERQERQLEIRHAMKLIDRQRETEEATGRSHRAFYGDWSGRSPKSAPPKVGRLVKTEPPAKIEAPARNGAPARPDPAVKIQLPLRIGSPAPVVGAPSRQVPLRDAPSEPSAGTSAELRGAPSQLSSLDAGTSKRAGTESLSLHVPGSSESEDAHE